MERLYAPWRMEYIGGPQPPGCLFCRVRDEGPARDADNLVVWRGELALVMLNRYPYNPGHVLVAPRRHTGNLADLDDADALALHHALARALGVLGELMSPEGFNVGANLGREAGAGIPDHVHMHAVPRWNGDTNFMPVLGDVKVVNEHLERTREKLAQGFSRSS